MRKQFAKSALALMFLGTVLASCVRSGPDVDVDDGECDADYECGQSDACATRRCQQNRCVVENAPAGSLAASSFEAPACNRLVCDGNGGEVLEVDPSVKPMGSVGPCRRLDCDANGKVIEVVDPTIPPDQQAGDCNKITCDASGNAVVEPDTADVPEDYHGDCRKPTCDASGNVMEVIEPGDEPAEKPGDCKKNICNAAGYPDTMPADDPPVDTTCQTFTCKNGQAVGAPINEGMSCSPHGLVCGSSGACDTCPKPDFACTDNGPASQSHSVATAYDLGKIGDCDSDGYLFCGLLEQGEVEYFSYIATGDGFLCENDPFVSVSSATSVKLCEYFSCPSVTCPSGSVAATLNGMPGCCAEGVYPSMAINPSCTAPQVVISVESTLPFCAGYKLDFHH